LKGKDNLGSKSRWESNIKMDVKEMGREAVVQRRLLVKAVMNLPAP
jgi:hypothetical protein